MELELAGRWARLRAALVDGLLMMIFYLLMKGQPVLGWAAFWLGFLGFLGLLAYQWMLLTKQGQTIGKKLCGIRIVKASTGDNGGFVTNVLLRQIVNGLISLIPFYFLVDCLFIFRADKRCIHDFLAGTRVVKVQAA